MLASILVIGAAISIFAGLFVYDCVREQKRYGLSQISWNRHMTILRQLKEKEVSERMRQLRFQRDSRTDILTQIDFYRRKAKEARADKRWEAWSHSMRYLKELRRRLGEVEDGIIKLERQQRGVMYGQAKR